MEIVSTLLDRRWGRPNVNAGRPAALNLAARRGHADVVALLIEAGADVNAGTRPSKLMNAIITKLPANPAAGGPERMKPIRPSNHPAALFDAIGNGHTDVASLLIDAGADVNAQDNGGRTALMYAVQAGDLELVSTLLDRGADLSGQDLFSGTALTIAARAGDLELVSTLLDRGADVNARSDSGETALIAAAGAGEAETVSTLLDRGADVNAQAKSGRTALRAASMFGHKGVAELLRRAGGEGEWPPAE